MIVADEGVTVTGLGTPTRPYVIGVDTASQGLKATLAAAGDETMDLWLTGEGTSVNKLVINGHAKQKLTNLTDVADPEGPQTGDVPVWMGTHWEFRPPAAAPPGSINVQNPLSGDGSSGSPLGLKTTGVWGAADPVTGRPGLDKWGTDSHLGQPIYVDADGKARTAPIMIPDADYKPSSASPTQYPYGVSVMCVAGSHPTDGNWPGPYSGNVVTFRRHAVDGDAVCAQWYYRNSANVAQAWYRSGNTAGSWTSWSLVIGPDTGWLTVTGIASGWNTVGEGPWQARQIGNRVSLRGMFQNTSFVSSGGAWTTIATLPTSIARPPHRSVWALGMTGATMIRSAQVLPTGEMQVWSSIATTSYYVLAFSYLTD